MEFDLSTAEPVNGFDLSTAVPVRPKSRSLDTDGKGNVTGETGSPAALAARNPMTGMSAAENYWLAAQRGVQSTVQGVEQRLGNVPNALALANPLGSLLVAAKPYVPKVSNQDVANERETSAPLLSTSAGKWGNLTGTVGATLPLAAIPGANTMAGASAIGTASGFMQPSASNGEMLSNTAMGATLAPASLVAGRALGTLYQGGKAALEPLFSAGQQRIAGRTLQAFAGPPEEAAAAQERLTQPPAVLPGVQPTTAELANNAGISQLSRVLRNNPEYATTLANRDAANRAVMTQAVGGIAGTDAERASAQDLRSQVTDSMYRAANNVTVPSDARLESILSRPSMTQAWNRAQQLAAERGDTLLIPGQASPMAGAAGSAFKQSATQYSGKAIQYLKMALNDIANSGPQNGMGAHEIGAVKSTLGALNDWTAQNVPKLRMADQIFARLSEPLSQMDVGQQLSAKLVPALNDLGGNAALRAGQYANALRNGDQLAANATGWKGSTLAGVLSPEQMTTVRQVGEQLARQANAAAPGVAGSNTGQNLVGQNLLRQFLGPLGLPQSMSERAAQSTLGQTLTRPLQFVAGFGEQNIRNRLADAMLDPAVAGGLLGMKPNTAAARALWKQQGLLGTTAVGVRKSLIDADQ